MARSKNSVSLIGVVGKDAELRQTQQGVHYAQISLATSTGGYKKKDGTDVPEVTQWHRIVAWNNLADFAGNYVKKGMKIAVDGMITYRTYKNQQGVDVYTTDIVADSIDDYTAGATAECRSSPSAECSPATARSCTAYWRLYTTSTGYSSTAACTAATS